MFCKLTAEETEGGKLAATGWLGWSSTVAGAAYGEASALRNLCTVAMGLEESPPGDVVAREVVI
jgi:hypothetical protein